MGKAQMQKRAGEATKTSTNEISLAKLTELSTLSWSMHLGEHGPG